MAAGTISATIKLDQPDRIHCGSNEPVTGNVVLRYRSNNSTIGGHDANLLEFFGPLKIRVNIHGRLKTKIHVSRGNSSSTYRGRVPIFKRERVIFDDSAKISASDKHWMVPFELSFPSTFQHPIGGAWEKDRRFDCNQEQQLPPSFASDHHGFSRHYESFIEYRVGVIVTVPHVPVNIVSPEDKQEPLVHYGLPRVPRDCQPTYHRMKNTIRVSNELLLPEEDRPSGFRQNLKAKMKDDFFPHYNFDWTLVAPKKVHVGQPVAFEVAVRVREDECTAIAIPQIKINSILVTLKGYTVVRVEKQFFSSPEADHDDTLANLKGFPDSAGPFSKDTDWRKTINTRPLPENIPSSFRTVNITQMHAMKLSFRFEVAGKSFPVETKFDVAVLPSLAGASTLPSASTAVAGPSSQPMDMQEIDEALPRYEEGLPEYHEAVESGPPQPPPKDVESMQVGSEQRPA